MVFRLHLLVAICSGSSWSHSLHFNCSSEVEAKSAAPNWEDLQVSIRKEWGKELEPPSSFFLLTEQATQGLFLLHWHVV